MMKGIFKNSAKTFQYRNFSKLLNQDIWLNQKNSKKIDNVIYKGFFSEIYLSNDDIITKKIDKNIMKHNIHYKNELNILSKLNNKNIIEIKNSYSDNKYFYMEMDYYPKGDLYHNIYYNEVDINNFSKFIKKLALPILYTHNQNIVHMDIKLENYLVGCNDNFVLIDFQLSKYNKKNYYELDVCDKSGTPSYMAPEIYDGYYCKATDMYSLGCLLYCVYTRTDSKKLNYKLLEKYPRELDSLIRDLTNKNPQNRPTIYDVINLYQ